ncbi:MAG TPA: GNAT family N-acetyltransferase [Polyangiaceae bacterium]|nr:GNAT family N-acetyltransferase [Polyangiaceae bacterium]
MSSPIDPQKARIRAVEATDISQLVQLNCAAYPDLIQDEVVWTEPQLRSHLVVFPEGQLLAEIEGRPVGAISTLILHREIDPLAPHTWLGVTDNGYFVRHDREGDTLYLADIYVHPDCWGRGIGVALYGALRDLCRRLALRRIVAGGRLWSYGEVAHLMNPETYVARVARGELHDRVLVSQLRAGFSVRGILPGYLHDWRSRHFATLLEWQNPDDATRPAALPDGLAREGAVPQLKTPRM